jgi:hypothetical protein
MTRPMETFDPHTDSALPFLVLILIVIAIGSYGVIRATRGGLGPAAWLLAIILIVAVAAGYVVLQSRSRAGVITVHGDRVEGQGWSIPFSAIRELREDLVYPTQYIGGRPVTTAQRRIVVETDSGPRVIAYEATYDIDALHAALQTAVTQFQR